MLPIIYVDNHLLVIEKPAGLLSQADRTGDTDVLTLAKAWVKREFNKPGDVYLGLVHRLDRPASGLMVLARTSKAAARLSDQFKNGRITKQYLALVEGNPPDEEHFEDWLLKRYEKISVVGPKKKGARKAELDLKVVKRYRGYCLVQIDLATGRAHQIRVQCSSRGYPLIGDFRYGSRTELDGRNLALHAARLQLEHPTKKEPMTWRSRPPNTWPTEVQSWLDRRS